LTIEVTGQKNVASKFAFVLVDAFDVPAVTISRLQDTDPAGRFLRAGWVQGVTGDEWSGGTAAGSLTRVTRHVHLSPVRGCAGSASLVPITAGSLAYFWMGLHEGGETYARPLDPAHQNVFQVEHFKAMGLADTSHTLTIEVTGPAEPGR